MSSPPSLPQFRMPAKGVGFVFRILLAIPLVIILLTGVFSSFYTVSPEAVAVVQRFGKFTHVADPGLHFKISPSASTLRPSCRSAGS